LYVACAAVGTASPAAVKPIVALASDASDAFITFDDESQSTAAAPKAHPAAKRLAASLGLK